MASKSVGGSAHPQVPRFLRGFAIAAGIGLVVVMIWSRLAERRPAAPTEVLGLVKAGAYVDAAAGIDALMNEGAELLAAKADEKAAGVFVQARDLAAAARAEVLRQRQAAPENGAGGTRTTERDGERPEFLFSLREAEACYRIAGIRFRQLQRKYAEAFARARTSARFVPPVSETEAIRKQILRGLVAYPDHKQLHRLQGVLDTLTGRFGSAERALRRAIELDPQFAAAYVDLARVYVNRKQLEKARESFEKALLVDGEDKDVAAAAHYGLGCYHEGQLRSLSKSDTPEAREKAAMHRAKAVKNLQSFLKEAGAGAREAERVRQALTDLQKTE